MVEPSMHLERRSIKFASDCSGLELVPKLIEKLGYECESLWCSETSEHALSFIRANAEPGKIFRDITERDNTTLPKDVDLYVSGPPCTAFSSLNNKKRMDDP